MLPPGQMIGTRYQIDRLLGQGGMSNLYLARDLKHQGMVVVIKEMTARYNDPTEQKNAEDLFMREADLLAKLNHPHIPKVFDKFKFQGKFYLSMEYVDGEDLGKKLTQRPAGMPEKQVAEWGLQMATVLYYLHCHKPDPIVFRDVKPSNMMIVHKTQTVKLIDFGIARFLTPTKKGDTMRIGSPGYAPPEQYSGQTDPRSDVYALGVTLHHAVTGRDPTTTQTPFLLPPARELNPAVSTAMAMVIEKATQLDPDKRYPSMLEMKRELQAVLRNHGVIASQTAPNMGLVPPLPAAAAAPAAATTAAGSPVSPAGGPGPGPTPTPSPAPVQAGTVTTLPAPRRSLWPPLLLSGCLAASLATAWFFPGLVEDGQQGLAVVISKLKKNTLPDEPGAAGLLLYQKGGPLPQALHLLAQARKAMPADPAVLLAWNNSLVLAGSAPVGHLVAVVPEGHDLRGLALGQTVLNAVGGVGQHMLVLDVQSYAEGKLAQALSRAESGRSARKSGGLQPPDGLVVFADTVPATRLPTVVVASKPQKSSLPNVAWLPVPESDVARVLASSLPPEVKDAVWLFPDQKPPEKSGVRFKVLPPPGDSASAATLLKAAGGGWVVGGLEQARVLLEKPDPDLHLLVWAPDPAQLPEVDGLFKGEKGPTLVAITGPSQLCADAWASAYFREYPVQYGEEAKPADEGVARAYDALQWCALRTWQSGARYAGVSLRLNSEGEASRSTRSRWVGTANGWTYKMDLEEQP